MYAMLCYAMLYYATTVLLRYYYYHYYYYYHHDYYYYYYHYYYYYYSATIPPSAPLTKPASARAAQRWAVACSLPGSACCRASGFTAAQFMISNIPAISCAQTRGVLDFCVQLAAPSRATWHCKCCAGAAISEKALVAYSRPLPI